MGERERNQTYTDRNDGRYENAANRDHQQHEQHERHDRDEHRRTQGSEPGNYYERNYGQHDRGPDERNFGARNAGYESRNYLGSQGRFGSQDDHRHDHDWERERARRFEHENSQGYNQSYSQGYGQGQHSWQGSSQPERSQPYGYDRNYAREYLGGGHGQGLYEGADWGRIPTQSPRYGQQRDWNSSGGGYGYGQERDHRGEQRGREDDSWGQQLRDVSQQVARKVKRVFRSPKGYKRSDERIREDLNDHLGLQQQLDPSDIEVQVSNGEVTLTGSVQSRHEKFLAEEIADDIGGVNEIHNQLRVRRDQHQGQSQGQGQGQATVTGTETTQAVNQNASEAARRTASRS